MIATGTSNHTGIRAHPNARPTPIPIGSKDSKVQPRGTHTSIARWRPSRRVCHSDPINQRGTDCSDWFHQLQFGEISKGLTMTDFWKEAEVLGHGIHDGRARNARSEVSWICWSSSEAETWLVIDLKTRAASYRGASAGRPSTDTRAKLGHTSG